MKWEKLIATQTEHVERLKVFGGWLVRTTWWSSQDIPYVCQTFVADPEYVWIEKILN
jgi:hypothetical protein